MTSSELEVADVSLPAIREWVDQRLAEIETPEDGRRVFAEMTALRDAAAALKRGEKGELAQVLTAKHHTLALARMDAHRSWGQALGDAEHGGDRRSDQVSSANLKPAERFAAHQARGLAAVPDALYQDWRSRAEAKRDGEAVTLARVLRLARDANAPKPERPDGPGSAEVREGDFREVLADLRDVDAIITDPPYPKEYLPLLGDLADWADRVLAPEGVLAVLLGQSHLPTAYHLLNRGRPYRWTMAYLTPGAAYVSHQARVQSNWKPVLVYGGGPRFADTLRSEGLDAEAKHHHHWGQDFAAFCTLIERLTAPGQFVVDPFCGGGTTLAAAVATGRRSIGCDVDSVAVATTRERLCL